MESQSGMSFQKIVIIVAVVLLVITLTVIGYMLKGAVQSQPLVTNAQLCPDLWTNSSGECQSTKDNNGKYPNAGNFILSDVDCLATSMTALANTSDADNCFGASKTYDSAQWVQGNTSNGLDDSKIYLLASALELSSTEQKINSSKLSSQLPAYINYTPGSYEANQKWAKAYNISWDGVN